MHFIARAYGVLRVKTCYGPRCTPSVSRESVRAHSDSMLKWQAAAFSSGLPSEKGNRLGFSDLMLFWDVDTQLDFMMPGGSLYIAGAEKIIPNLRELTAWAGSRAFSKRGGRLVETDDLQGKPGCGTRPKPFRNQLRLRSEPVEGGSKISFRPHTSQRKSCTRILESYI